MGFKRKYMLAQHLANAKANIKGSTAHGVAEHEADRLADKAVTAAKADLAKLQTASTGSTHSSAPRQATSGSTDEDCNTALNGMETFEMLFDYEGL